MSLLGLELSDAGILVAVGNPPELLRVDGSQTESPGFAVPDGNRLLVGLAAQKKAHLNPVLIHSRFWDQLNTKRLKSHLPGAGNNAEIAFAHLNSIWRKAKRHGDEVVMAVPGFVGRYQLGIILSMCEELSMPLKGIFALPVAAAKNPDSDRLLMHADIHLHRLEVSLLSREGDRLVQTDTAFTPEVGFLRLYRKWVESIGTQFVRTTRFDPLHRASSEQELYDRLPRILSAMEKEVSIQFSLTSAGKRYTVTLSKDLFLNDTEGVFWEIRRLAAGIRARHSRPGQPLDIQITHRIRSLPGWELMLGQTEADQLIELELGAGAFGAISLWEELYGGKTEVGVSFVTSRPWHTTNGYPASIPSPPRPPRPAGSGDPRPTHLLYRHRAYPITQRPILVGRGDLGPGVSISIAGGQRKVSKRHCSVQLQGGQVLLTAHSTHGTYVDDVPVGGTVTLRLGQVIRVGDPGETLELIAVESDET